MFIVHVNTFTHLISSMSNRPFLVTSYQSRGGRYVSSIDYDSAKPNSTSYIVDSPD